MKVLLIEDEALAVKRLRKALEALDDSIEIVGVANSILSSVEWISSNAAPDLILMDIELADGQSFEIFKRVQVKSPVIFVTSYDEFAIKAFKVNSVDYLMKPVDPEELQLALEKFRQLTALYNAPAKAPLNLDRLVEALQQRLQPKEYRRRFLVKSGQKLVAVDVEEIAYFFVDGRLSFFKTWDNKKYIVDYTMDELEDMLDPGCFFRINRSCCVALKSIAQVSDYVNSRLLLQLNPVDDKETIISRDRVAAFKDWMGR